MGIDEKIEAAWRGLITQDRLAGEEEKTRLNLHWFKKHLDETRQSLSERRASMAFAELHFAIGERVLKEYEDETVVGR